LSTDGADVTFLTDLNFFHNSKSYTHSSLQGSSTYFPTQFYAFSSRNQGPCSTLSYDRSIGGQYFQCSVNISAVAVKF